MAVNQYQEDMFAEWKNQRFIVVEHAIARDNDVAHLVVLTDIRFWADHADELEEWCCQYPGAYQMGMTVGFDTQELLTLFCLRWN